MYSVMINSMRAKPTPSLGRKLVLKRQFRIADIQHDFGFWTFQAGQVRGFNFEIKDAFIDLAVYRLRHRIPSRAYCF